VKADFDGYGTRRDDASLKTMADWAPPTTPAAGPQGGPGANANFRQAAVFNAKRWNFLLEEGVALVVDSSSKGSGGTVFVSAASAVQEMPAPGAAPATGRTGVRVWDKSAESRVIPQMTMSIEDANRLIRMMD